MAAGIDGSAEAGVGASASGSEHLRLGPIRTVEYHSGGQPLRIVVEGGPELGAGSAAERRLVAMTTPELDSFRTFLCGEPRGHADMYACYLFESEQPDCDLGVVFCHSVGYPPSCGHGTIALAAYAVESGRVQADPDGETAVAIEVPAGRSVAWVAQAGGVIQSIRVDRGPTYSLELDRLAATSRGDIAYDLVFSGAAFACVEARSAGLSVTLDHSAQLASFGGELLGVLNASVVTDAAPDVGDKRLNGVFGVIFFDDSDSDSDINVNADSRDKGMLRQRAVNVFNDGWIERSPGGAMIGARLALLHARGEIADGATLVQESISGARALAKAQLVPELQREHPGAIRTTVWSTAHRTGENLFATSPTDELAAGFSLR